MTLGRDAGMEISELKRLLPGQEPTVWAEPVASNGAEMDSNVVETIWVQSRSERKGLFMRDLQGRRAWLA